MAAPKSPSTGAKTGLARVVRELDDLVLRFEAGLLRSRQQHKDDVRHEARRLALAEYTRRHIGRSLRAAEQHGRRIEQQLHAQLDAGEAPHDDDLCAIHHGYFRLYSTDLFDLLGQPIDLRLGTVRFHHHHPPRPDAYMADAHVHADADTDTDADADADSGPVSVELALGDAYFVAESLETLPYHAFKVPRAPSLQNRGILSRKPQDNGAFPDYDSWLLFTFLGNGCLKLEVPIEMCADVYGGPLAGRENEEVHFWGVFVDDDAP